MIFELMPKDWEPSPPPFPSDNRLPPLNCPGCGKFVKVLRTEQYYNGTWDCARLHYRCHSCGEQYLELV